MATPRMMQAPPTNVARSGRSPRSTLSQHNAEQRLQVQRGRRAGRVDVIERDHPDHVGDCRRGNAQIEYSDPRTRRHMRNAGHGNVDDGGGNPEQQAGDDARRGDQQAGVVCQRGLAEGGVRRLAYQREHDEHIADQARAAAHMRRAETVHDHDIDAQRSHDQAPHGPAAHGLAQDEPGHDRREHALGADEQGGIGRRGQVEPSELDQLVHHEADQAQAAEGQKIAPSDRHGTPSEPQHGAKHQRSDRETERVQLHGGEDAHGFFAGRVRSRPHHVGQDQDEHGATSRPTHAHGLLSARCGERGRSGDRQASGGYQRSKPPNKNRTLQTVTLEGHAGNLGLPQHGRAAPEACVARLTLYVFARVCRTLALGLLVLGAQAPRANTHLGRLAVHDQGDVLKVRLERAARHGGAPEPAAACLMANAATESGLLGTNVTLKSHDCVLQSAGQSSLEL